LRTAQRAILTEWHDALRSKRDLIVKLHTGQGKTLIGLLMLQSKLNEGIAPRLPGDGLPFDVAL
jgi:replicative superfamily II helicase